MILSQSAVDDSIAHPLLHRCGLWLFLSLQLIHLMR
jgi:hypothetical protein